jgi:hypothetical protein
MRFVYCAEAVAVLLDGIGGIYREDEASRSGCAKGALIWHYSGARGYTRTSITGFKRHWLASGSLENPRNCLFRT